MAKDRVIGISGRKIGEQYPTFIIAEMSANHLKDFNLAVQIIKAAKESGADAIKLQTYTADTLTLNCSNDFFQIKQGTLWDGKTLHELYEEAYTPWDWQPKLKKIAEDEGLICFSTPFDKSAVDFLSDMNVGAYKIASFEITDIPLIEYIASKKKPIILSTGIAELKDIEEAVCACKRMGNDDIILLKCTSAYPAPIEDADLKTIPNMIETFDVIAGLSDHTMGISAAVASVALGGRVIEKHFTLDRKLGGPDSAFSLEPSEFSALVKNVREAQSALGSVNYSLRDKTRKNRELFSRSLFVAEDIKSGEIFTQKNVRSVRPGFGLSPKYLNTILGKKARCDIKMGTPLSWELVD